MCGTFIHVSDYISDCRNWAVDYQYIYITFSHLADATYSNYRDNPPEVSRVKCLAQGHNVIFGSAGNRTGVFRLPARFPHRSATWLPISPPFLYYLPFSSSITKWLKSFQHLTQSKWNQHLFLNVWNPISRQSLWFMEWKWKWSVKCIFLNVNLSIVLIFHTVSLGKRGRVIWQPSAMPQHTSHLLHSGAANVRYRVQTCSFSNLSPELLKKEKSNMKYEPCYSLFYNGNDTRKKRDSRDNPACHIWAPH